VDLDLVVSNAFPRKDTRPVLFGFQLPLVLQSPYSFFPLSSRYVLFTSILCCLFGSRGFCAFALYLKSSVCARGWPVIRYAPTTQPQQGHLSHLVSQVNHT
jgi:hypothetical protein